jgi:acyl-CoA hydrolase
MKVSYDNWQSAVVSPETAVQKIKPGMHIFLGTAMAEPRTMVRHLLNSNANNLEDIELLQLISFGDAVSLPSILSQNYRLKTFFSGSMANRAIAEGRADLIPIRHGKISRLIKSRLIPVDVAIVQISPPDRAGYCNLGNRCGCGTGSHGTGFDPRRRDQHPYSQNVWRYTCTIV